MHIDLYLKYNYVYKHDKKYMLIMRKSIISVYYFYQYFNQFYTHIGTSNLDIKSCAVNISSSW